MLKRLVMAILVMNLQPAMAEEHAQETPAQEGSVEALVEQIHRQNILHQQELQALDRKLEEYEKKREIARVLKETLETGVVDEFGNIRPLGEITPGQGGTTSSYTPAPVPAPATAGQTAPAPLQVPKLAAVKDKTAYFRVGPGQLVSGEVGSVLPGGFVVKSISLNRVLLDRGGVEFVTTQTWNAPAATESQ